jgi:hypothetical protein
MIEIKDHRLADKGREFKAAAAIGWESEIRCNITHIKIGHNHAFV